MSKKQWEVVEVIGGVSLPDILCGLLIAQGIPAIISREGYGSAKGLHYGPAGETEVLVPSDYVNQAHEIINLYYAGAFETASEIEEDGVNSSGEGLSPHRGDVDHKSGKTFMDFLGQYFSELSLRLNVIRFPGNAEHHFILGYYLFNKNKDLEKAEKEIRQAVALRPQDWRYILVLAYVLHTRAKYSEANENYQDAIKLIPPDEKVHLESAYINSGILLHEKLNRFDEAEKAYRGAIELNPDQPFSQFQLGHLLVNHLHRYAEAETYFLRALELDPQDETTLYNLACIKSFSRDADLALDYLRKAIEKGFDRDWAANDKDLEWLKNDPRFTEIVGSYANKE